MNDVPSLLRIHAAYRQNHSINYIPQWQNDSFQITHCEWVSVLVFAWFLCVIVLSPLLSLFAVSLSALIAHSFCLWMLNDAFIWNVCSYLKLKRFFFARKQSHLSLWARSIGFFAECLFLIDGGLETPTSIRHGINNSYFGKNVWSCLYRMNIKCVRIYANANAFRLRT